MELYVHIPFCARKCRYCDFASYAGQESQMHAYVNAVLTEAKARSQHYAELYGLLPPVETVFIGGGTPSLLPADEFDRLLDGICSIFTIAPSAEFTSEANPGTLTKQWLDSAVQHGVNRLSLGMQAYQPELLQMLGRIHSFEQVQTSVEMARQAGISNISLDLMFGLPGQTLQHWHESLEAALSLHPQHLSCYGLIPEDGTPLKRDLDTGKLHLPDEEQERLMYDDTLRILSLHGFSQYEISNFALPGYACRHNLGYWRQIPYLGLGASAASCMDEKDGNPYVRVSNPAGLAEYISCAENNAWSSRISEAVTVQDARFETMMLGLRTTAGVNAEAFAKQHGISLDQIYGKTLARLAQQELVLFTDGFWRLTRKGMDVQNAVLVELMEP